MKNKKNNLPNIWDLVESFLKENNNIKYCMSYKTFYNYKGFWTAINKDQLTRLFITFLKSKFPDTFKKFNLKNLDEIFLLISQHEEFSMPDAIAKANSNGFLLPFMNGVLNTRTLEFSVHSPSHFSTHIIPIEYKTDNSQSLYETKFADFLSSLVNYNNNRLKVLRACLYLIFTNNLLYQIALYIYGPGGTGKSTFINLLIYLLGKEVTLSSSISQINSRFGIASIVGKYLLILNDVSLYRGQEPKNIKNIVTQDTMEAEIKYKQPFMFTPNCFLILASNVLWDIKNTTTGLSRRMIYFPFDYIPSQKEFDLFRLLPNNVAAGSLIPDLGGFINWILSCPQEYLDFIYKGGSEVTDLISQESIHVNPLNVFVKDCLLPSPDNKCRLGSKTADQESLYGFYCMWCRLNGIHPMSFKSFSILLIDLLKQQGWEIEKKRTAVGFVIKGVSMSVVYKSKAANYEEFPDKVLELEDNKADLDEKYKYYNNIPKEENTTIVKEDFLNHFINK